MTFLGSTGTLELNTGATLTVTNALAVGANTVLLDGAGSTLTDTAGLTLAGGTISGLGTLAANTNITGSGTVERTDLQRRHDHGQRRHAGPDRDGERPDARDRHGAPARS